MKRRGFLQGLFCVGVLAGSLPRLAKAFVPEDDGVALFNASHPGHNDVNPLFKCTERFSYGYTDPRAFSNELRPGNELSQECLDLIEAADKTTVEMVEVTRTDKYLQSDTRWYLKTDNPEGLKLYHRDRSGEGLARVLAESPAGVRYIGVPGL